MVEMADLIFLCFSIIKKKHNIFDAEKIASEFNFQHPVGDSQRSVIPFPTDLTCSSALCVHQAYTWYRNKFADKVPIHIK